MVFKKILLSNEFDMTISTFHYSIGDSSSEEESDDASFSSETSSQGGDEDNICEDSEEHSSSSEESPPDIAMALENMIYLNENSRKYPIYAVAASIKFSKTSNLLSVGTVNGDIEMFSYEYSNVNALSRIECFTSTSCTDIDFSTNGDLLFAVSPVEGFVVIDNEKEQLINYGAVRERNHLTKLMTINDNLVCTGDERGFVKYWDVRLLRPYSQFSCCRSGHDSTNDYVSSMIIKKEDNAIAVASGAGVISIYDMRNLKILNQYLELDADLLTMTSVKNKEVIVAGSLKGKFVFIPWKETNHSCDTYDAVPDVACNEILTVGDRVVISAWDDCMLRIHSLYPHKLLGTLGKEQLPPQLAAINPDNSVVISTGFDQELTIWDIKKIIKKINKDTQNIIIERMDSFFSNL